MPSARLSLVSDHLCPYVQRAAIALAEKGVAFERVNIDLAAKPDWFLRLSPLGKVPLLIVARDGQPDAVLFESAVICEYLEETQDGAALHPGDPLDRARHRGWIEYGSSILADLWGYETASDRETFERKRDALVAKFTTLETALGAGRYFAGDRFCLVDATFAPIFRYFDLFDTLETTNLFEGLARVTAWRAALSARESVRTAVSDDYPARLKVFLENHDAWLLKAGSV